MAAVVDPEKTGPRLLFQRVPEGKTAKNRVHLDVNASKPHGHTDQGWRQVEEHVRSLNGNEFCVQ